MYLVRLINRYICVIIYLGILSNGCLPFLQSDFRGVERGLAYDKKGFFNNYVNSDYNTFNNIQLEKAPNYIFVIRVLT